MSSITKPTAAATARRKSQKPSKIITLHLSSKALQKFAPRSTSVKGEEASIKKEQSSATSTSTKTNGSAIVNGDSITESEANTPAAAGTPSSSMPPPTEIVKKKPGKRTSAVVDPNAPPKVRGKPGPKKKARLEDGSIDHSAPIPRAANAHRLGPRANQGAINAGLRALDRTGKPCRKWAKAGFQMKSFTGVVWDMPRWKAPPKSTTELTPDTQSASGDSSRENKENSQMPSVKSDKSNSAGDIEMTNTSVQNAPSPASSAIGPPEVSVTTSTIHTAA